MANDLERMERALALARATSALASPNPQVGCVLTRGDTILAEGAHRYAERDHAEIVALKQAGDARGATAYVTLEPCSHHGRTGPCADALIAAGITRCVVATVDPNPQVAGSGIARMRAAGIVVEVGLCQGEARAINDAFAFSVTHGRPFVTLKAALSVDGMLAPAPGLRTPNQPHWLTGPLARAEVQMLRHASDAILTGIGTVLADDPALTDRTGLPRRRPLLRIILDPQLRIPMDSQLVRTANDDLRIFCNEAAERAQTGKVRILTERGATVSALPGEGPLDLAEVLRSLHEARMLSVLLEAGSALNAAFLRATLVDRAILFYAESELGPGAVPFARGGPTPFALEQQMLHVTKQQVGADVRVSGLLHDPWHGTPHIG